MNRAIQMQAFPIDPTRGAAAWLPAVLFFAALAFDFRAEESGGSSAQYLLVGGAALLALFGSRNVLRFGQGHGPIAWPILLVTYLVVVTLATMPMRAVDPGTVLRTLVPYVLFILGGLLAEATTRRSGEYESRILTGIFVTTLLSCAWTYFYATQILGVVAIEGRHRFVSLAAPQLFALSVMVQAFGMPQKRYAQVALIVTTVLFLMSTTRAYLLMMAVVVAYLGWVSAARWMSARNIRAAGYGLAALVAGAFLLYQVAPEFFDRWTERVVDEQLESGEYASIIEREAEWRGQLDALTSRTNSMLFGVGIGSTYYLDQKTLSRIPGYKPDEESARGASHAGHSYWIYAVYAGGAATGWVMPLILVLSLLLGLENVFRLRKALRAPGAPPELMWHAAMGATYLAAVVATFAMSFSSNAVGERFTCALFGFSLVAARAHLLRARQYIRS